MTTFPKTLVKQRAVLVSAVYDADNAYDEIALPGCREDRAYQDAHRALLAFDAAHPEVEGANEVRTVSYEMHSTLASAVHEFRVAMTGLHARGGGRVAILEEYLAETGAQAIVSWEEHCSGGFGSGSAWVDVNPEENLNRECPNEGCCWHAGGSQEMCEDCEHAGLEMVLDHLLNL